MKVDDLITICLRQVFRNRRRYKAVTAAIAFGAAGLIVIQSIGDSVDKRISMNLELLGEATVITAEYLGGWHPSQFTIEDIEQIKRLPHVIAVAPVVSLDSIVATHQGNMMFPKLMGVDHHYWKTLSSTLNTGRLIGPSSVVAGRMECIPGRNVVKHLFQGKDPLGCELRLGNLDFTVVGTLGGIQSGGVRNAVFIPFSTARRLFDGLYDIKDLYIRVNDWNKVKESRDAIFKLLRENHRGYHGGIRVEYYPKRVERVQLMVKLVKIFVYATLSLTLLLGGMGVSTVMLAAVQDRTQEIGLRKALGAHEHIIMLQFLLEAVITSVFAGLVGVGLGFGAVYGLKRTLQLDVSESLLFWSCAVALGFTFMLGVLSGLYPSIRASRLDPVTAMRFE